MEYFEFRNQYQFLPEAESIRAAQRLLTSIHIFDRNHEALEQLLDNIYAEALNGHFLALENRPALNESFNEIHRHFHNTISAAMALRAHTLRLKRTIYTGKRTIMGYDEEVKRHFSNNNLTCFVQGLRNYILHEDIPLLGWIYSSNQGEEEFMIYISAEDLLKSDFWNVNARAYLSDAVELKGNRVGEKAGVIEIRGLIHEYYVIVREFYDWFGTQQNLAHRWDFEAIDAFRICYFQDNTDDAFLELRMAMDSFEANEEPLDNVFLVVLTNAELRALDEYRQHPEIWVRTALQSVEKRVGQIPTELRERMLASSLYIRNTRTGRTTWRS